jgi:predicted DNA-binding protein
MGRTRSVRGDDAMAREISALAGDYGITERGVVRQLVEIGLDEVERLERV